MGRNGIGHSLQISNMFDAAMLNAWKLHCLCRRFDKKSAMTQLDFKGYATQFMLQSTTVKEFATTSSGKISKKSAANAMLFDRVDHLIVDGKRPRCRQCTSNITKKMLEMQCSSSSKMFSSIPYTYIYIR